MNSAFSQDTFLDTVIKLCVYILQMLLKFRIFLGHLPGHGVVFFGLWYILKMLQKFHIFLGHLPRHRVFFFGFSAHYIMQMLRIFLGHLARHGGLFVFGYSVHYIIQLLQLFLGHLHGPGSCFFRVFRTLRHPDAPAFLGTFTETWGLFFLRVFHTQHHADAPDFLGTFSQTRVVFFRLFRTLHHPAAPAFLGTFTWTWELFFSGFPHITSSRCSSFSWDIYTDIGVVFCWVFRILHHPSAPVSLGTFTRTWWFFFSGLPAHYIMQMLRFCLGHLPEHRSWFFRDFHTLHRPDAPAFLGTFTQTWGLFFFGFSTHYIMQVLRIFLGHLPRHRACSFQVFWTLNHADAPGFLRTFTWTLWVVFFGFLYILQMLWKIRIFLGHLYRQGLLFLGFPHTISCRCSGLSWDIYLDTRAVFLGFSAQY